MRPVKIGLVGVGGYAASHLHSIELLQKEGLFELTTVAIRSPKKYAEQVERLARDGVRIREGLDQMLDVDRDRMEMVAIPTGIDNHRDLLIRAVEAGLPVILEKPTAATIQDFAAMEAALNRSGRFCQIGFQSQSDAVVKGLKREICSQRLGAIKQVVVTGLWVRQDSYYARNRWAGSYMLDGRYILDGTINNPLAHYLFNGLYFASCEWGRAAVPVSVRAELYRGHKIESEDTSALEVVCDNGAKVNFYATLCSPEVVSPTIDVIGEKGWARWTSKGPAVLYEGEKKVGEVTDPEGRNGRVEEFRNAARYLRGLDAELNCPLAMTRSHVLAVNGAFESAGFPVSIPSSALEVTTDAESGEVSTSIKGIRELIARAAAERALFSDLGVPWAQATQSFPLENYTRFERVPPLA